MDLHALDYFEFELLVGLLLKNEGYDIVRAPSPRGYIAGADYEVISPNQIYYFVEVKHFKRPIPISQIERFLGDLERSRESKPDSEGLIVTSGEFTPRAKELIAQRPHIKLWDSTVLTTLLEKHPEIASRAGKTASARSDFFEFESTLLTGIADSKRTEFIKRLKAVPPGKDHWRAFEEVCVEILSLVFSPELGPPDIQSRSDDGLDIIDAIYPIRSSEHPWAFIRSEYGTRFVVCEFKNYTDSIGQQQVESIAQYLWRPAKRTFGVLISRSTPSEAAFAARRRAWLETEKCIVFLSDEDLIEMLKSTEEDLDPFDLIDMQLEDFFRSLAP